MLTLLFVLVLLLFLIFMRIPIFLSLFLTGFICFMIYEPIPMAVIGQIFVKKLDNYSLIAIPFFIFLGNIMVKGQSAKRLVELVYALVSPLKGGLPIAAVNSCGLFGAISGSSISTLVTIGGIILPSFDKYKYDRKFAIGILTSSSVLGIIIPPSVPMIICAMIEGESVNRLFIAGIVPGIVIMLAFSVYAYIFSQKKGYERTPFPGFKTLGNAFWKAGWSLLLPVILYVGIYSGAFTVTEAAIVAVAFAIVLELIIYRTITLKDIWTISIDSGILSGTLVIIVSGAMTMGEFITMAGLPNILVETTTQYISSTWVFLFLVVVLIMVIGTFLDIIGALAIMIPVMMPLIKAYGVDPIHFGIIMCLGFGIGYITPPLGLLLYTAVAMTKEKFTFISRAIMPTLTIYVGVLLLVAYIPQLSLWLPNLFYGK